MMQSVRKITLYMKNLFCVLLLLVGGISTSLFGEVNVALKEGVLTVYKDGKAVVALESLRFDYHDPVAVSELSSGEDGWIYQLSYAPTVEYAHRATDGNGLKVVFLGIATVEGGLRFYCKPDWANQTTLVLDYLGDHFFGLSEPLQPDNQHSPDLTGAVISVDVVNEGQRIVENYASAFSSFYMSSYGYGSFFDTFARGTYEFDINGKNKIHHDTGVLDWYLFFGDDGANIHESYFKLIGQPKKLPMWALGPIVWRDQNDGGAREILSDVSKFGELKLPITGWFVDRPYADGNHAWSEMNFSKNFHNPDVWIKEIRDQGIEFMTWTATSTFGDERFPKHLRGRFSYIDLSHPESYNMFKQELAQKQYVYGVKGHKMDRADEVFPKFEEWHDVSVTMAERRNKYVYLFTKVHDEALREAWGEDQFSFARAAIHRSQPYLSAIWGGDPRSSWQGMRGNLANAMRAGFMGFPVWGSDVGGYIGDGYISEELYIRWMQLGAMSGFFEIKIDGSGGDGEDRAPWRYDEAFQSKYRTILEMRMLWLPYLYSLANTSGIEGVMMQPMAYRHLDDPKTYGIWDQYYLGKNVLVAPILDVSNERDVYLPEGKWRAFNDFSNLVDGKQTLHVTAELEEIPFFIKSNSIGVTGHVFDGNSKVWSEATHSLEMNVLAGEEGESCSFIYVDSLDGDKQKVFAAKNEKGIISVTGPALTIPLRVVVYIGEQIESYEIEAGNATEIIIGK